MMMDEERPGKGHSRLARVARPLPDTISPELRTRASSSRSSTLASLRCLSTLPVYGPSGTPADVMLGAGYQQSACYHGSSRAQAVHYAAYLKRKVSSAVSSLNQLMRKWEAGPEAACTGQLPSVRRKSDGGRPATQSGPAAPPSSNAAGLDVSLAVAVRKRSAGAASLDEPSASARHACPPTSSLHPTSRASDDCGTPSGPADPVSQADCGWDGTGESAWVPPLSAGDAGPVDSSSVPHNSLGAAVFRPCSGPTPDPSIAARRECPVARGQQQPGVAIGGTTRSNAGSGPCAGAVPLPGRPVARPGPGGPHRPAPLHGGNAASLHDGNDSAGGVPFRAGAVALPPPYQRAATLGSNMGLRLQPGPPGVPREAPGTAGRAAPMAVNLGVGSTGHGAFAAQCGMPLQRAPPSLCDLPAPSWSIQQLVSRRGPGCPSEQAGRRDTANPQPQHLLQPHMAPMVPPFLQQPRQQQQEQLFAETATAQALGDRNASVILGCSNPRLRAAVEATAAATAAHWQQQVAALPPMTALFKRWSLTSLRAQLSGSSGLLGDTAFRGSCGGYSSAAGGPGGAGGVAPLFRHTQTPLPRRRAAAQLDLGSSQGTSGTVPLGALSEPLPADTCQGRSELWDLFLLNLPFAAGPGSLCGPDGTDPASTAVEADSSGLCEGMEGVRGGDARGPCAGCRCCGGGSQERRGAVMEEQADVVDAEGGQDDSDVYMSSEGLVCLASLVSTPHSSRGGWRLPFLVRPRRSSEVDKAQARAAIQGATGGGGCRCNAARCQRTERPVTLYFAEPLRDVPGLLSDSWSRMCASGLAVSRRGSGTAGGDGSGCCPTAAAADAGGIDKQQEALGTAAVEEDCPCCQQDEWQLGRLSLLVLSHCDVGLAGGSRSGRGGPHSTPAPAHVVALAGASGAATSAAVDAVALRYPELACRAELLSSRTTNAATVVVIVDPDDGALLAQQCLDRGALQRLAAERSAQGDCWLLVHDLLNELQRLPPGPYMLRMDADAHSLELRGVGRRQ